MIFVGVDFEILVAVKVVDSLDFYLSRMDLLARALGVMQAVTVEALTYFQPFHLMLYSIDQIHLMAQIVLKSPMNEKNKNDNSFIEALVKYYII